MAGAARIHHDVPPFVKVAGDDEIRGLNVVGLRRSGFSEADVEALRHFLQALSPQSLYYRFHGRPALTESRVRSLVGAASTAFTIVATICVIVTSPSARALSRVVGIASIAQ